MQFFCAIWRAEEWVLIHWLITNWKGYKHTNKILKPIDQGSKNIAGFQFTARNVESFCQVLQESLNFLVHFSAYIEFSERYTLFTISC